MRTRPVRPSRWRRRLPAAVAVAIAAATIPLTALPSAAVPKGGQSIEVFTGTNLVSLTGYPANRNVEVKVLRKGFLIGEAVKRSDASGAIEMNHVGGADCFEGKRSPDIQPGDVVRTRVVGTKNVDRSVVRGVFIDSFNVNDVNNTINVAGHVTLGGAAKVVPGQDVLELRINIDATWDTNDRPGRRDRRVDIGNRVNAAGNWSISLNSTQRDIDNVQAGNEHMLEWSPAVAGERFPPELTVWDQPEGEALQGCPPVLNGPTAPLLAKADDSRMKGDHITKKSTALNFAGITNSTNPSGAVTLRVDGAEAATANAKNGVYRFGGVTLAPRAKAHQLTVTAAGAADPSVVRRVIVDQKRPLVKLRSLRPGKLDLTGTGIARFVYRIGESATVKAKIVNSSGKTVRRFDARTLRGARLAEYKWNGKNNRGNDVAPGAYRMRLTVKDRAGNVSKNTAARIRVVS